MTTQIEHDKAKAEFREMAIETLTKAFKQSSGYSAMDHGIDHWRQTAELLYDTMVEVAAHTDRK